MFDSWNYFKFGLARSTELRLNLHHSILDHSWLQFLNLLDLDCLVIFLFPFVRKQQPVDEALETCAQVVFEALPIEPYGSGSDRCVDFPLIHWKRKEDYHKRVKARFVVGEGRGLRALLRTKQHIISFKFFVNFSRLIPPSRGSSHLCSSFGYYHTCNVVKT